MDQLSVAAVSGQQAAALRAALALDAAQAQEWRARLIGSGDLDGFSELVYAAFVVAVRRYFAPAWTRADVVRYVGRRVNWLTGGCRSAPYQGLDRVRLGGAFPGKRPARSRRSAAAELLEGDRVAGAGGVRVGHRELARRGPSAIVGRDVGHRKMTNTDTG